MTSSADRRTRSPRGEGGLLRGEILNAATALLARLGDDEGLSLRAVARAVGVSAPSLYLHFPDKEALVRAVVEERFAELARVGEVATAGLDDPAARLVARARAFVSFGLEHPGHWKVLYEGRATAQLDPAAASPEWRPGRILLGPLTDDVVALQAAGRIPSGDEPEWLARAVWQALHGVVALRINKPGVAWGPAEHDAEVLVSRIVRLPAGVPPQPTRQLQPREGGTASSGTAQ